MIGVAIVDSDETMRASVRALIGATSDISLQYEEAFMGDGTQGILRSTGINILMLGLPVQGLPAEELIREIKGQHPSLRIILVTALATMDNARCAFEAGATGFIAKPNLANDLLAAIRRVASGGVYVSL